MKNRNLAYHGLLPLIGVLLYLSCLTLPARAAGADAQHLGVASCAGSTCHGATTATPDTNVQLNEYVTWVRRDKHAKAYEILLSNESQRIARNLGIGDAHTAKMCLDCHADNPPANLRSPSFQISEGVGCEGCHGGAQNWLSSHTAAPPHSDNVAKGMIATEDPMVRAGLCLSCHFGNQEKFVTHRMMGAGHPRMSFELDTFTQLQPAHFVVDEDYRKRKGAISGIKLWAIGQAMMAQAHMAALSDSQRNRDGLFPEFVLFDCHSCHTPMSNKNWQPRSNGVRTPGMPHVNDSSLVMLQVMTQVIDPALGQAMSAKIRALHQNGSAGMGQLAAAANDLRGLTSQMAAKFAASPFDASVMKAILKALVQAGTDGSYSDYADAEQAAMAIDTLIAAMTAEKAAPDAQLQKLSRSLDAVFAATAKDEAYQAGRFNAALAGVRAALGG
ncbi:MAG: multiheme c-type cytochrome [Alphaproteobacteria bacterium]